jgi:hypothetical protein
MDKVITADWNLMQWQFACLNSALILGVIGLRFNSFMNCFIFILLGVSPLRIGRSCKLQSMDILNAIYFSLFFWGLRTRPDILDIVFFIFLGVCVLIKKIK